MTFGERLKKLICFKKIKQKDLAKALGVNECCVCHWVKNQRIPQIKQFANLSKYFGLSIDTLWFGNETLDTLLENNNE